MTDSSEGILNSVSLDELDRDNSNEEPDPVLTKEKVAAAVHDALRGSLHEEQWHHKFLNRARQANNQRGQIANSTPVACLNVNCSKPENPTLKLLTCSSCRSAMYCSAECQRGDWPAHKPYCKKLKKQYEEAKKGEGQEQNREFKASITDFTTLFPPDMPKIRISYPPQAGRSERRLFLLDTIVHLAHDETLNAKYFEGFGKLTFVGVECGPLFTADKDVCWFTLESDAEVEKATAMMSQFKGLLGNALKGKNDGKIKGAWDKFEEKMKQNGKGLPVRVLRNGNRRYQLNIYDGHASIWRDVDMKEVIEGSYVLNDKAAVMPKQMIIDILLEGWKGVEGEETVGRMAATWEDLGEREVRKMLALGGGAFGAFNVKAGSSQWLCYVNTRVFLERAEKKPLGYADPEIMELYEKFEREDIMRKVMQEGGIQKALADPSNPAGPIIKKLMETGVFNHMDLLDW